MRKDKKVFNDPIYGFITIPFPIIERLIDHPWFQRLRRIQQLGLTNLVYPGALHTRFHHAVGAMHLMGEALEVLRSKDVEITEEEAIGVTVAILLHDIGHGPFSHSLEFSLVKGVTHENLTEIFMSRLNAEMEGQLETAISIFRNQYPKKFLHQLVSSQLDMDRLDYLRRDSFYAGVAEGVINTDRIIKMLNVYDDQLVVDGKGIYSIEKFIIARRLMYWQVYMHKTAVVAENMLINILRRARELLKDGNEITATPQLYTFLSRQHDLESFRKDEHILRDFSRLDDYDIYAAIKSWCYHNDALLSFLSKSLVNRRLFKIRLQTEPFDQKIIEKIRKKAQKLHSVSDSETGYLVITGELKNDAYQPGEDKITIVGKNNRVEDIADISDNLNITVFSARVKKYFVCCPEECLKGLEIH
ncbi:MAG: HD domain-containing protein [Flavobacteriales bacterium]|nr:HD domain-containing protein [Flavobacteriales bacterium]